jgi:hypothetical protein
VWTEEADIKLGKQREKVRNRFLKKISNPNPYYNNAR